MRRDESRAGVIATRCKTMGYGQAKHYRPQDKGLMPFGAAEKPPAPGAEKKTAEAKIPITRDWTFSQILRSSQLWLLILSYCPLLGGFRIPGFSSPGPVRRRCGLQQYFQRLHFRPFRGDCVPGPESGFLSDRMGRERAATMASALSIAALAALLFVRDNSQPWLLYVYSVCFGYGGGLFTPTIFAGSADIFYGRYYGTVSGLLLTGMGVGAVFGPWLGGYIYDVTGSYRPAFILCTVCIALSCMIFWIAAPRKGISTGVKPAN